MNRQNYKIWLTQNPHMFQEISLQNMNVGVWCTITQHRITGLIFHEQMADSEEYHQILTNFIALLDTTNEEHCTMFQQDGQEPTHLKQPFHLYKFFDNRVVFVGAWSPRSTDLSPADFLGYVKDNVYWNYTLLWKNWRWKLRMQFGLSMKICHWVFGNLMKHLNTSLDINRG